MIYQGILLLFIPDVFANYISAPDLTNSNTACVQWKAHPMISASGRTELIADHNALLKSNTTLLTDGWVGRTLTMFLRT